MQRTCGCERGDVTNGVMLTCVSLILWLKVWHLALFSAHVF